MKNMDTSLGKRMQGTNILLYPYKKDNLSEVVDMFKKNLDVKEYSGPPEIVNV